MVRICSSHACPAVRKQLNIWINPSLFAGVLDKNRETCDSMLN